MPGLPTRRRDGDHVGAALGLASVDDGKGSNPTCMPAQLGCCRTAPFRPHLVQRADRRSMSLDVSGPQRMMNGTNATGVRCKHFSHTTQDHGWPRWSCSRVGIGDGARSMAARMTKFASAEQPRGLGSSGRWCLDLVGQPGGEGRRILPRLSHACEGTPCGRVGCQTRKRRLLRQQCARSDRRIARRRPVHGTSGQW